MNYQDHVMWNLVKNIRNDTIDMVSDLDEKIVNIIPQGYKNSIKWNIGHIILDQEVWFHYLIDDKMDVPEHYKTFFGFGTSPATWEAEPPSWNELLEELRIQPERLVNKFAKRLDQPLQQVTEAEMSTIGEVIPRTLYHEGLHQGAIIALLKSIESHI
ncbi:DinB family protein [Bacillus horti]|uniref:DinB-like domain-containing protein n=1 Tax=Caldalkalibacillus horti TaxID=77523 RepID=A0ABT9W1M2_9BACI|nr:DinB family protein [Bacillus horti]MDQ0166740.1 hypothetical protein [Bacillus horti]